MRNILRGEKGLGPALKAALVVFFLVGVVRPASAEETKTLWKAVRLGKAFAMTRHALAPGTGDPENFKLNGCSTQRNLSDQGRKQAEAIGERFRKNGIERAAVFSSQWCRCQDTADRLRLGSVRTLAPLNSFFSVPERRGPQTTALRDWLASYRIDQPLVLVHPSGQHQCPHGYLYPLREDRCGTLGNGWKNYCTWKAMNATWRSVTREMPTPLK